MKSKVSRRWKVFSLFFAILMVLQSWCFCPCTYAAYNRLMELLNDCENLTVEDIKPIVEANPVFVKETYSDENMKRQTVVYYALKKGKNTDENRLAIVKYLVEKGASMGPMWEGGLTPLHDFAKFGYIEGVKTILNGEVDPNCRTNEGGTPLHSAAFGGKAECVKLLIEKYGANPNCRTNIGGTPLHYAAFSGKAECVKVLFERGADPMVEDLCRKTPVQLAKEKGYVEILRLLQSSHKEFSAKPMCGTSQPAGGQRKKVAVPVERTNRPTDDLVNESAKGFSSKPVSNVNEESNAEPVPQKSRSSSDPVSKGTKRLAREPVSNGDEEQSKKPARKKKRSTNHDLVEALYIAASEEEDDGTA